MSLPVYVIEDREALGEQPSDHLLVMLHGWGATERDFAPIGPLVDPRGRFLVAAPRGPHEVSAGGWCWFDSTPKGPDLDSLKVSVDLLAEALGDLQARSSVPPERTVLMGFSQGGAMALAYCLWAGDAPLPGAAVCLSGWLPDLDESFVGWERARGLQVLIQHGERDGHVPFEMGHGTAQLLATHGSTVTFDRQPMAHQLTLEGLAVVRNWLETTFGLKEDR